MEFSYLALDKGGRTVEGSLEADDERAASRQIRRLELQPLEVRPAAGEAAAGKAGQRFGRRAPSAQDKALIIRELGTMLNSGMQLAETVHTLAQAHAGERLGEAFGDVHRSLRSGNPLSLAMAESGVEWPAYLVQLIKAGEQTGRLGQALFSAADQMEYEERVRQEMRSALVYPSILVISGIAATLMMFIVVVPKFASILKNSRADIPALSVWVLQTGLFVKNNLLMVGLGLLAAVAVIAYGLGKPEVRLKIYQSAAGLPLLGRWLRETDVGRWATMMATLLDNHVPILRAMEMAQDSVLLLAWRNDLQQAMRGVKGGKRMAEGLTGSAMIGSTALNLIRVGEQSGQLPKMMRTLATLHENQGRERLKRLLVLLEPLAILCIGGVIGVLMVAIMLAITSLSNISL